MFEVKVRVRVRVRARVRDRITFFRTISNRVPLLLYHHLDCMPVTTALIASLSSPSSPYATNVVSRLSPKELPIW